MGVFATLLRFLFFKLDELVFGLIGTVYTLLVDIAETSIFSKDIFSLIFERIYGILGIFMLFKVSFSILTYIVNPDDFTDKNKGFSKMVSNILVTLVLLVLTPWFFDQAMDLQKIILKDNIIGRLILGVSGSNQSATQSFNPGNQMAYQTLNAFYHIDTDRNPNCKDFVYGAEPEPGECLDSIAGLDDKDTYGQILKYGKATQSVNIYLDWDLVFAKDSNDNPIMSYTPLISTIAGGFIVYVLISFCFDIAVRSVKLGFLQLIAPIPIISRIDPKKGKEVFDKWVKNCFSTYVDIFVRLLAVYFSVFVITELTSGSMENVVTGAKQTNLFVKVFVILGALLFAKQLPNLLQDLLGIKLDGKFSLSPLKKLGGVPLVGGALSSGATLAGGAALAGGRGLANLIGGGTKSGLGKLFGDSDIGNKLTTSGARTLSNTKSAMQKRIDAARLEASKRFSDSGLMGSEGYKGDTAHKMYAKEREKLREDRFTGGKEFADIHEKWQRGDQIWKKLNDNGYDKKTAFNGVDDMPYDLAYKSNEFKNSLKALDKQEAKTKEFTKAFQAARMGNSEVIANGVTYYQKPTGNQASFEALYDAYDSATKATKGLETVHETMRKKYHNDTETQDAIKFKKYNEQDPTGK